MPAGLAVQMYTLRNDFDADSAATCRRIAELGIDGIELFAFGEPTRSRRERLDRASQLGQHVTDAGLQIVAAHTNLPALDDGEWIFEEIVASGATVAVAPAPDRVLGFTRDVFTEGERLRAFARRMRQVAQRAREFDLNVAFHNHWTEWADQDGRPAYDVFAEESGDDLLLEVDILWAAAAGLNPADVIEAHRDRVFALHVKDAPSLTPGTPQCAPGEGVVPVADALAASAADAWHVIEFDILPPEDDVWAAIERSSTWWHTTQEKR